MDIETIESSEAFDTTESSGIGDLGEAVEIVGVEESGEGEAVAPETDFPSDALPSFSFDESGALIIKIDQTSVDAIKEILTPSPITKEFVDYSLLEILLFVCAACLLGNLIYKFFGGVSWRR